MKTTVKKIYFIKGAADDHKMESRVFTLSATDRGKLLYKKHISSSVKRFGNFVTAFFIGSIIRV